MTNNQNQKTLEQLIGAAAEHLPDGWEIRIEVQHEYGEVIVTRPDGTEVPMQDGESDIREQFKNAGLLIRDEIMADTVLPNENIALAKVKGVEIV